MLRDSHGKAVQVDPVKPTLKAHGTKFLKLNFARIGFKLCFQIQLAPLHHARATKLLSKHSAAGAYTRPLFSST